jgi:hypothetical protein
MFAFSPDRHAVSLHTLGTTDGSRRFVRTGVTPPATTPGSAPHPAVPHFPATAPTEPDHARAYPQADGEP